MARKDISFTAKDAALREDVHTLGALVGDVLRDQGGDAFFEEEVRLTNIRSAPYRSLLRKVKSELK